MRLHIQGLRKKESTTRYDESVEVDPDSLIFELLKTLFTKGIHFLQTLNHNIGL
jgi:hypothetical protein